MNIDITTPDNRGFTLIELMIVIAIIGILAAIAVPNFLSYRNKSYCSAVESDASNIIASVADYFAIPAHTNISTGDQSFKPLFNTNYIIQATDPSVVITVLISDESGNCPAVYTDRNPVNLAGNGWVNNTTFQKIR